ncbi:MAG TPA: YceI family protein [Bdellovibrionales bacterium]|jgi:polyisoprenoid-binding protein YceI|nr:YceI family protein [Bdellovibrionales bacterium]
MFAKAIVSISAIAAFASLAQAAPAKYVVDKDHSNVGFAVRHLMITDVIGHFKDFEGSFTFDRETGAVTDGTFTVKTASIDTDNDKRDEHLRSADFFDSAKHDSMTFKNSKLEKNGKDKYKWTGDLTIRGKTKPVTFDLTETGMQKDPWGNQRLGFHAEGKINRKDFGLKWNKAIEGGGVTVGEDVKIIIDASTVQQKETAPAAAPAPEKKK